VWGDFPLLVLLGASVIILSGHLQVYGPNNDSVRKLLWISLIFATSLNLWIFVLSKISGGYLLNTACVLGLHPSVLFNGLHYFIKKRIV
jgi:glycerol uptake facilitator-like aquaporin